MNCNCIREGEFDLNIDISNGKSMLITDMSAWFKSKATDYEITITEDNYSKVYKLPTEGSLSITANDYYGIKEDIEYCFKDIFLCISTDVCGVHYSITRAIMPSIERALNKIMLKDFDKYVELKTRKETINILLSNGLIDEAMEVYEMLKGNIFGIC